MDDFGSLLGSTFGRLGQQVASGVAAQIDGVAVSVGQALRDRGIATPGDPQQQQQQQHHPQQPGGGVRSSRSAASSAAGTPSREEVKEGARVELHVGLNRSLHCNPALLGVDPVLQACCVPLSVVVPLCAPVIFLFAFLAFLIRAPRHDTYFFARMRYLCESCCAALALLSRRLDFFAQSLLGSGIVNG